MAHREEALAFVPMLVVILQLGPVDKHTIAGMKPVAPVRLSLHCDPYDTDAVRAWLAKWTEREVGGQGQPSPAIHILCDRHREVLELHPLAQEPDFDVAATYRAVLARKDVVRALVVGNLEREDGPRAAVILQFEESEDEVHWWAMWRGFVATPDGLGSFTHDWEGVEGEGEAEAPFNLFLLPAPGAKPCAMLLARMPEPDMRALMDDLPPQYPLPVNAMQMTEFASASTMPTVLKEGLDHARIFRLRGRAFEMWLVKGDYLPSSMDDLLRYISGRGEPAQAVALAIAGEYVEDGQRLKAVHIRAEMAGRRAERIFTFKLPPGAQKHVPSKTHWRELGGVPEGAGWIGVDPMVRWDLFVKGAVGAGQ